MKIENLIIKNFRGIKNVELNNLGSMIIIAGQNGSGKSCIFDGIRLLKSVYGGYQQNEWQQWMGEFQIQLTNRSSDFKSMFNDPTKEVRIVCDFKIPQEEKNFLSENADELIRETIWRSILPEAYQWGGYRMASFAAQFRDREPEVAAKAKELYPTFISELAAPLIRGEFFIPVGGIAQVTNCTVLNVIFSTFRPQDIGVIDYHGAQRHYNRENVQGINLSLDAGEQQRSQTALYNPTAKYNNVKSELATSYVKEILAEKAGKLGTKTTLTDTLKELFETFFPEKEFMGPQPTSEGILSFPVKTLSNTHDLDELSTGEKEILYGYLRIRNSAPKNSIILLDEPELHLNPRLIRGLPQFYNRHLGEALNNQIWLVTHSDALLREVVTKENYNVFHMLPSGHLSGNEMQLKPLLVTADLEFALVDLVGDLATYHPGGKVIIFEGGGDADFDQQTTSKLFPELLKKANLISGSNKTKVKALHDILANATKRGQLPFQFFAIVDKDSDQERIDKVNVFQWDVYHIENYLLNAKYIGKVLRSLGKTNFTEEQIMDELLVCARETLSQLIRHKLAEFSNGILVGAINTSTDPSKEDVVTDLDSAIQRSIQRISVARSNALSPDNIRLKFNEIKTEYEKSLANGDWLKVFRGRDILKRYTKNIDDIKYDLFKNMIIAQMSEDDYQPEGMKIIIDKIIAA